MSIAWAIIIASIIIGISIILGCGLAMKVLTDIFEANEGEDDYTIKATYERRSSSGPTDPSPPGSPTA